MGRYIHELYPGSLSFFKNIWLMWQLKNQLYPYSIELQKSILQWYNSLLWMGETEWSMVMSAASLSYRPKRIAYNQSKARKRQCCQYHNWLLSFFGAETIRQKQKEEASGLKTQLEMDDVYIKYDSKLAHKMRTGDIYRKNIIYILNTIQKWIGIVTVTQREMLELVAG